MSSHHRVRVFFPSICKPLFGQKVASIILNILTYLINIPLNNESPISAATPMQALLTLPLSSDSPCQTVPPSVRSSWPALALIPGADWPHACRPASPCLGPDTIGQGTSLWGCPPHHSGRQATVHAQTTSSSCSDSDSPHQAVPLKTRFLTLTFIFFNI